VENSEKNRVLILQFMSKLEILAIIPARGGSKGIPGKNIKHLNSKPLLAYTALSAMNSKFITRRVLSTDDTEIAKIGAEYGLEVPFMRPSHLASDLSPSLEAFQFTLKELAARAGYIPDLVVILQPTSPLRNSTHIDEAIEQYIGADADSLVSIVKIPHHMTPFSAMQKNIDGYLHSLTNLNELQNQRQNKPIYFARNGAAIYITNPRNLVNNNSLFGKKIIGYEMSKLDSIDIDDEEDWALAEALLQWKTK
jgi:CMP-N,N'-diacetyllegionaminic acid synthase